MNAALWGAAAALFFGLADFLGRFTGRALGPRNALLGLMLVGAVLLSLYGFGSGLPVPWRAETVPVLLVAGVASMVAPLVFYKALTLGPLSLAAPITAAYPALIVPVEVAFGARPGVLDWAAMAATLLGTVVVARTAGEDPDEALAADRTNRRKSIACAALASVLFAVALLAGRHAVEAYGEVQTLWVGRVVGFLALGAAMMAARVRPVLPVRWWPVLLVQGLVDALAYLCFYVGSQGEDASAAAVASSAFMVVVVLLGWAFLRERISPACWGGILLVFGGVATLSG